jgi:hypothetical protein
MSQDPDPKTRSTRAERKRRLAAKEAARIEKQAERRSGKCKLTYDAKRGLMNGE